MEKFNFEKYCSRMFLTISLAFLAVFVLAYMNSFSIGMAKAEQLNTLQEQITETTAEQVIEKVIAETEKEKKKKAEITAQRPKVLIEPTKIHFFIYILDIDKIDAANQSFTANIFVRLRWKDERLAHEGSTLTVPLDETWNPRLIIANKGGLVLKSLPEVVRIRPDGTVMYRQRYNGPLSQPLKLYDFPFDEHKFSIQFIATGYSDKDIEFIADTPIEADLPIGGDIYHEISLSDWEIIDFKAVSKPYEPIKGIKAAGFVFEFNAQRNILYYIWQVMVPLVFIVGMAWGAFYIDPANAGAQIGIATSSMLTLIAYRFMLSQFVPKLPYMTRLDYFMLGSTVLVFLTLIEVIVTTNLELRNKKSLALKMDIWCRFLFPIMFILWSYWSLILK